MNVLAAISPTLKVLFERVGKPEIVNRSDLFRRTCVSWACFVVVITSAKLRI
jgi:hypothetical protein